MENKIIRSDFFRSLLALKSGYKVETYEADETNFKILLDNLAYNYHSEKFIIYTNENTYKMIQTMYAYVGYQTFIYVENIFIFLKNQDYNSKEFLDDIIQFCRKNKITSDTKTKALETTYDEVNEIFNKINIDSFKNNMVDLKDNELRKIDDEINSLKEDINDHYNEINNIRNRITTLQGQKLTSLIDPDCEYVTKTINFIKKSPLVNSYCLKNNNLEIITNLLPIQYTYAEERTEKVLKSNFTEKTTLEILTDALTERKKYAIYIAPLKITIYFGATQLSYSIYDTELSIFRQTQYSLPGASSINWSEIKNRHYERYKCLGGFQDPIFEAKVEYNPLKLIMLILQYLQTLNIADHAGTGWIQQTQHLIYDKEEKQFILLKTATGATTPVPREYLMIKTPPTFIKGDE